jgi:NADPH:quinone reductase-like Zn-dependent oxidoreductase
VGHLAVQIAKARGAHVIGTARAAKHAFLRKLGADETVDHSATELPAAVRDADVVIQMFGGERGLTALECLRPGGILVSGQAAWTPGLRERAAELGVRARLLAAEGARVAALDLHGAGLEALADLVRKGRLTVHVDRTFPLAEAADAHRLIAEGHTTGKLVLTVAEPDSLSS